MITVTPKNKPVPVKKTSNVLLLALPIGIALLTFICYHYSLGNQFTNWDDERFIPDNIFIRSFSSYNLKMMMFHDVTGDYYNPLTILSYAVNYHFSGVNPEGYYLTNIIIHILNSCLMFFLVRMMLNIMEKNGYGIFKGKEWLALFCTLAYAIHPMHVESVAWAAERKDVMYGFFYFLGMVSYLHYTELKERKYLWLFWVFLCFVLSLLAKPMAVVFPFSLLAMDVLLKRDTLKEQQVSYRAIKNIILEKLPFLVVAIISAVTTYHAAKLSGAVQEHQVFTFFQRFLFACYGFYMYILKAFEPYPQTSFYPYPDFVSPDAPLPIIYYLSPFIALAVAAIPIYVAYRFGKNNFRVALFGFGFYFFNMIIISQIVGAGPNLMAERYSYISYFGIFFPVTYYAYRFIQKSKQVRIIVSVISSLYLLLFSGLCYERTLVWHDSQTLWTDVIEKYPHRVVKAYNNLGNYYFKEFQKSTSEDDYQKAYENYKNAIDLKVADPQLYCNMGSLLGAKKNYTLSMQYYTSALAIDSNDAMTYLDRGVTYSAMEKYDLAIKDYEHSLKLNPNSEISYRNIAFAFWTIHRFDSAIKYYNKVIEINPTNPEYFHNRGVALYNTGVVQPAINDFIQVIKLDQGNGESMFYLAVAYNRISDFNNAYKYAEMAVNAKYAVPDDFIRLLKARLNIK